MKRLLPLLLPLLAACATPTTALVKDGDIQTCGGSSVGFILGGKIGQGIQEDMDRRCVEEWKSRGYRPA